MLLVGILTLFSACHSASSEQIWQEKAEEQTALLCNALENNASMDSIRTIAEQNEQILFYVFDARQLVYWSSNRIASDAVYLTVYDTWRDMNFSNARAKIRWTKAGIYNVLTVIPLEYIKLDDYTDISSVASQTFSFRELLAYDKKPYTWYFGAYSKPWYPEYASLYADHVYHPHPRVGGVHIYLFHVHRLCSSQL